MMGQTQFTPYPEQLSVVAAIPPTSVAATGDTEGGWINLSEYEGNVMLLLHTILATAGTNPTLTVVVQHRASSTDTPATVPAAALLNEDGVAASFAVVTGAANGGIQKRGLVRSMVKAEIRLVATVGGTSNPAFKFSASAIGSKKYGHQ